MRLDPFPGWEHLASAVAGKIGKLLKHAYRCGRYQREELFIFGEWSPLGAGKPADRVLALQQFRGVLVEPIRLALGVAVEEVVLERAGRKR